MRVLVVLGIGAALAAVAATVGLTGLRAYFAPLVMELPGARAVAGVLREVDSGALRVLWANYQVR